MQIGNIGQMGDDYRSESGFDSNTREPSAGDTGSMFTGDNAAAVWQLYQGSKFLGQGQEKLNRYINFTTLRFYFQVNNSYVLNKLRLLLLPYTNKVRSSRSAGVWLVMPSLLL
jgi:protein transport protein YIF1